MLVPYAETEIAALKRIREALLETPISSNEEFFTHGAALRNEAAVPASILAPAIYEWTKSATLKPTEAEWTKLTEDMLSFIDGILANPNKEAPN